MVEELQEAFRELAYAWEEFNWAERGFIDIAIFKILAAEKKCSELLKLIREGPVV